MELIHIGVFTAAAALIGAFAKPQLRGVLVLTGSVLAVFWLQPISTIRGMGFWFPVVTIALTVLVWLVVRQPSTEGDPGSPLPGAILIVGAILLIGVLRYIEPVQFTATTPPPFLLIIAVVGGLMLVGTLLSQVLRPGHAIVVVVGASLVGLLVVLKWPPLATSLSAGLRGIAGQSPAQASLRDLRWIGISYVIFRLIYALQAHEAGKLERPSLTEFANYVLFFPSFTAGPIAQADKFLNDWRDQPPLDRERLTQAGTRIVMGLFKKYAIADTLALIALNDVNALQTDSTLWTWVLLYIYALRIFYDFAGYTDIAIGIGMLLGVKLPENFDDPYRKPNLSQFWNSWHISLAIWFRALYFNPGVRWMRRNLERIPSEVQMAIMQVTTMILVGIWHGITLNFFIWGAWHGVGLFVHNRYARATRTQQRELRDKPQLNAVVNTATAVLTVQFVVLGWVWFALSSSSTSWIVFMRLFGLN